MIEETEELKLAIAKEITKEDDKRKFEEKLQLLRDSTGQVGDNSESSEEVIE